MVPLRALILFYVKNMRIGAFLRAQLGYFLAFRFYFKFFEGCNNLTPLLRGTSLQFGGKILETFTILNGEILALRNAISKLANSSLETPTPLVKKILVGIYIVSPEQFR